MSKREGVSACEKSDQHTHTANGNCQPYSHLLPLLGQGLFQFSINFAFLLYYDFASPGIFQYEKTKREVKCECVKEWKKQRWTDTNKERERPLVDGVDLVLFFPCLLRMAIIIAITAYYCLYDYPLPQPTSTSIHVHICPTPLCRMNIK